MFVSIYTYSILYIPPEFQTGANTCATNQHSHYILNTTRNVCTLGVSFFLKIDHSMTKLQTLTVVTKINRAIFPYSVGTI
jgi:hypothetical protein